MELKNTYKSKIVEKKISSNLYFASIDNNTMSTDTISKAIDMRFVQFYFCLKGKVSFHFSEHYSKILEEGMAYMIYNPEKTLPLQISISSKSKLNVLVISIDTLHKFFNTEVLSEYFIDTKTKWYEEIQISNALNFVFTQLESQSINLAFENLFYKNKINEILILYFSSRIKSDENCPFLSNEDVAKKIKQAKNILVSNLNQIPKIESLAHDLEISTYKLKEGFKKIYGSTITQFVLQHKMQLGKQKIETKKLKIKDIALDLGYENPSHFIDAFKKSYGITPKQYEKTLQ